MGRDDSDFPLKCPAPAHFVDRWVPKRGGGIGRFSFDARAFRVSGWIDRKGGDAVTPIADLGTPVGDQREQQLFEFGGNWTTISQGLTNLVLRAGGRRERAMWGGAIQVRTFPPDIIAPRVPSHEQDRETLDWMWYPVHGDREWKDPVVGSQGTLDVDLQQVGGLEATPIWYHNQRRDGGQRAAPPPPPPGLPPAPGGAQKGGTKGKGGKWGRTTEGEGQGGQRKARREATSAEAQHPPGGPASDQPAGVLLHPAGGRG